MSSIIARSFHRNVTRKVPFFQPQKYALRNSNPQLFQSSLSRYYTNSTFPSPSSQESALTSNLEKRLVKVGIGLLKRVPAAIIANIIVSFIGAYICGDFLYAWYRNGCNKKLLNETVEKGTRPAMQISEDILVPRHAIMKNLKMILQPNKDHSFYHVICGEHGTGKTTLTKIASREVGQNKDKHIEGGMGVIYVDVLPPYLYNSKDDPNGFGVAFGKAINFVFNENIATIVQFKRRVLGITTENPETLKWQRAMEAFKQAAAVYREKYKKPPVIVYDNVSRLDPKILDFLQDDAKDSADNKEYIAVFISNESSVLRRMESRSAWSRADKPVIEISDLNEKESKDYLINRCTIEEKGKKVIKIKDEEVNELYNLVGGRIMDLNTVVGKFLKGQSLEVIKEQVFGVIFDNLEKAGMNSEQPNHEVAKIIIRVLLNSNDKLHISMLRKLIKMEPSKLLMSNIFAYHPSNKTITFQSQTVEYYIRENANKFINSEKEKDNELSK